MRSSPSTHAILSLPHKYRVPLRHKRSLDYARDDDTRERAISHSLSFRYAEGCPCGAVYPPPSARPFFKGPLSCHVKAPLVKTTKRESPRIVISSGARNLPCTSVKQRAWDDDKRNTPGDASDNDTKNAPLTSLLLPPALNPSPLYAKIELSLISLLTKSIAGIGFS